MQKYNSSLKITGHNKQVINEFVKKLTILCTQRSFNGLIQVNGHTIIKKKNTILRSPHVHKKARDQIEIQHISYFFKIRNGFNWLFFLISLKKYNNLSFSLDYKHALEQQIYYKSSKNVIK